MKSKYFFKKGTKGKLSEIGYYGYWYPGSTSKYDTIIIKDIECEHLQFWKNQHTYFAFKVPAYAVKTLDKLDDNKFVCVWIRKEDIENGL
tara:strand:- start:418 stop:687 length:270 start_codon:yes stop_codon:yes gene_type:complete